MSLFDPKCHYKWNAYLPTVNQCKRHQSLYFPHNTSHFPTGCYCEWRPWQYFMHKFLTLPTICERYSSGFRYWGKTGTSRGKPQGSAPMITWCCIPVPQKQGITISTGQWTWFTLPTICEWYPTGSRYWGRSLLSGQAVRFISTNHTMRHACTIEIAHHHTYSWQYSLCPQCENGIPVAWDTVASVSLWAASRRVGHHKSLQFAYLQYFNTWIEC